MRVICEKKVARMSAPSRPLAPYEADSEFDITVSKEYVALGVSVWEGIVLLLLADDYDLPNWHPLEMFSVSDPKLSNNWFFSGTAASEQGVQAICGYRELVFDQSHYTALLERDPVALDTFRRVKAQEEAR